MLRRARPDAQLAERFFAACKVGDADAARAHLANNPAMIHARDEGHNATGLHFAAAHFDTARVLIDAGAAARSG